MYLLKIESGNGFEYCQLPKNFKKTTISNQNYFETRSRKIKLVLTYPKIFTFDRPHFESIGESKEGILYHCFLPEIKKDCISTSNETKLPTYKVITYVEDENNPSPIKCIVFDGKAYLIKEKGETIERF